MKHRVTVVVTTLALSLAVMVKLPAAHAEPAVPDGSSMATAAASCWEIKQGRPASTDGLYWVVTPRLQRPLRVYCDMTVDGGGWVLVGRGRDGWRSEYEGQGLVDEVSNVVTGTAAFRTRQMPGSVIDGLLNGIPPAQLPDGIRLRRATAADGSSYQEARMHLGKDQRWTWAFRARQLVVRMTFDGATQTATNAGSNNFGWNDQFARVNTEINAQQRWSGGFAYGSWIRGNNNSTTYLWSGTEGAGNARPFTQVYLRPKLLTPAMTYTQIPDGGGPAQERAPLASSKALPTVYGVAGLASQGGASSEMRTEVQDFAQIGQYMYVGGNFASVQRDASGTDQVPQSYLVAFNVDSGDMLAGFRPVFNNQIKALAALPDGRLAVGGEFTSVNGVPANGFVVLDPTTGAVDPGFTVRIEQNVDGVGLIVHSLKVQGGWLYLGGAFTHLTGPSGPRVYARNAARLNLANGVPDPDWNPNLNGTVKEIEPGAAGDRVYVVGYFTASNDTAVNKVAALSAAPGAAVVSWTPKFSVPATQTNTFQFVAVETTDRLWIGGSEHSFFSYDRNQLGFLNGGISMAGGDFQTGVAGRGIVYGGCHCDDFLFNDWAVYGWPQPNQVTRGEKLGFVGAWNASTGVYQDEFAPILNARRGYGAWASAFDSNGNLWIGGDFTSSVRSGNAVQWSGGFVRFPPRDAVAPAPPSGLQVGGTQSQAVLTWSPSSEGGVTYEVLQDDKVVATTTATSITLPAPSAVTRFHVRAADAAENRSATTAVAIYDPSVMPLDVVIIAKDAAWRWSYDAAGQQNGWTATGFDDSSWNTGAATLGFGATGLATMIYTGEPSQRPLTAYFRNTFDVGDLNGVNQLKLRVVANDGAVVYLNGQEVGRARMPEGVPTPTTYASGVIGATAAENQPLEITVPVSSLIPGQNTIAVETHLNYRSTSDVTFNLIARKTG